MSNNYVVEEKFTHNELPCCVVMTNRGYRCGYVGVKEDNRFWRLDFDYVYTEHSKPEVHGGLTYSSYEVDSGYPIETNDKIWWFGFDCGHHEDLCDRTDFKKYFPEFSDDQILWDSFIRDVGHGTIRTKGYVHEECRKLADWLTKNKDSKNKELIDFIRNYDFDYLSSKYSQRTRTRIRRYGYEHVSGTFTGWVWNMNQLEHASKEELLELALRLVYYRN